MNREEMFNYIKSNYNELLASFEVVFEFNKSEFDKIILQLLSIDSFYKIDNFDFFAVDNLINLKKYLGDIKLSLDQMKTLIGDIPYLILYSNRIDDIYPLFSYDEFEGIVLLGENDYKAYMSPFINEDYKFDTYKNILFVNMSLDEVCKLEYQNQFENNDYIKDLIKMGNREDIAKYYELDDNCTLKDRFDVCSSRRTGGNLHFYKSRNVMLERKAKRSSKVEDGFICDMCCGTFDDINIKHIIPVEMDGEDDIYNMACLCDECLKHVVENHVDLVSCSDVLVGLRDRLIKYPEYKNIMVKLFDINNVERDELKR